TGLALRLSLGAVAAWPQRLAIGTGTAHAPGERLKSLVDAYGADRLLSKQQRMILRFYLDGRNDKAIAELCGCSEATVYEHWRRGWPAAVACWSRCAASPRISHSSRRAATT